MSGGKSSQRKGRTEELAAAKEAGEFDLTFEVHDIYAPLDITIEGDPYEVKNCERLSIKTVYHALRAGARGLIYRCNRERRIIAVDYRDWLEDQQELKLLRAGQIILTEKGRKALAEAEAQDLQDMIEGAPV